MKTRAWAAFWLVGLIWGSSFLLIRIGVQEFRPPEIVFIRTAIAAVGLGIVIVIRRVPVPTDWRTLRKLLLVGVGNVVAPFLLITWSEQFITSGLAAVLQSTAALFALVVAHFLFADERIHRRKVIGLLLGFAGVVVLFSSEIGGDNGIVGMLGMVAASLCYATFTSLGRKVLQTNVAPVVVSGVTLTTAAVVTAPLAFLTGGGFTPLTTVSQQALLAVTILGLTNTFIAYLFYYFVVRELGVSRAAMTTYVVPPVGVVLGVIFLSEPVGIPLLLGGAMIFVGIGIVNVRLRRWFSPAEPAKQGVKS